MRGLVRLDDLYLAKLLPNENFKVGVCMSSQGKRRPVRVHVCMPDPIERAGGIHSYVGSLADGQCQLGYDPVIIHSITKSGRFKVVSRTENRVDMSALRPQMDAVHYHFALSALPFVTIPAIAPWSNLRRGFHYHGPWYLEGKVQGNSRVRVQIKRLVEHAALARFDRFVADSNAFREQLISDHGIDPSAVNTVLPGVDTNRFRFVAGPSLHTDVVAHTGQFRIVAVRRLEPRMGLEDAIYAVKDMPDVSLAIAGTGSMRPYLDSLVETLGLESRVKFLGRVPDRDLPALFGQSDLSLVPTRELEGFGLVVLESMAAGTPVIATDVGGLREAMGPFAADWLVAPRRPDALAAKIKRFRERPIGRDRVRMYAESRTLAKQALETESAFGF